MKFRELETERLKLRAFKKEDAEELTKLLQDKDIFLTTMTVPYPYQKKDAYEWIGTQRKDAENLNAFHWCLECKKTRSIIGVLSASLKAHDESAELGYWVGKKYWNQGYTTEAVKEVIRFAFEELGLNRVYAHYMANNPASGKVMQKAGMLHEGILKQHYKKEGKFVDVEYYGVLAQQYF